MHLQGITQTPPELLRISQGNQEPSKMPWRRPRLPKNSTRTPKARKLSIKNKEAKTKNQIENIQTHETLKHRCTPRLAHLVSHRVALGPPRTPEGPPKDSQDGKTKKKKKGGATRWRKRR